ncbi:MAG: hypothetical protein FWH31_00895 [Streptococcaceae bacterium]|nr:hypothetical protein [Streptococcaceae bacterium]
MKVEIGNIYMMTKKEHTFWLLSSIAMFLAIPFFLLSYKFQGWAFLFFMIGGVLIFFIKDKSAPIKPLPNRFWQKRWFWACIFIPLILLVGIFCWGNVSSPPYFLIVLCLEFPIMGYFQTKYDWRRKN